MFRKALLGLWVTCVCAMLSATNPLAAAADIVLYASDATNLHGNWSRGADASAAGGQVLTSADQGWSNTAAPQASPADSVDFVFNAPGATAYHVWMRMRAGGNSKYNDSLFTQFSDAVDGNGVSLFAIGTAKGLTVNLANDATGGSLGGWGWQDGAYWVSQPATIRFVASGAHTLRIQTREDGVQIDQVVLSPVTYLTKAPGALTSDATIVPKLAATLPAPWTTQAVGTSLAGNASYANGVFSVAGSGADIWGALDAFQFVSQPIAGNIQIVARVASLQNTNAYAKAGLMIRETASAGSAQVLLDVRPGGEVELISRAASGAATMLLAGGTQTAPAWLKLARSGASISGWVSANGTVWTLIGSTSIAMAHNALVGLAVTSHDVTRLNTATFDGVTLTAPPLAPGSPIPTQGVGGISTNAVLTWSAAGATNYDVSFGTVNPPALVATNISTAAFAPSVLANGATYYWQVNARNAAGTTAGPVWSFSTIIAAPAVPATVAPSNGVTGSALSTTLTWNAAAATSYDVAFGVTNPPTTVATNLSNASFAPAGLVNGRTYYWRVNARNAGGTTTGPVWSFTTIIAAPAVPTTVAPANGATGSALTTTLAWSAAAATSYDLAFGAGNPPASVATNLSTAAFAPTSLTNGTTYYWQVSARNTGGTTAGPVWSFTTVGAPAATPTNIVLYASDATKLQGNWALVADTTAAGGQALTSTDKGWANTAGPAAAPTDFFEMTFTAPSATAYHVWLRMRAAANSKYNDAVFAQFSDAVDGSGAAIYAVGTTSGHTVNLATDGTGSSLSGWGWQDGAYWLAQATTIRFAAAGTHTLRIQTREDGVSIDQIVISPVTNLTAAPGQTTNDVTIVPKPGSTGTPPPTPPGAPTVYNAISDRNPYPKPAVPVLGAAGYSFNDPTFGSKIIRVTDGNTRPEAANRSYRVPSNSQLAAWNASSTAFFVVSNDGTIIPYTFDPSTSSASRIQTGSGGLTLPFYVEPQFSLSDPNLIYGAVTGTNNRTIARFDFKTTSSTTIVDLDTIVSGLAGTYIGNVMTGGTSPEKLITLFGGASQDSHYYVMWTPVGNVGARKILNTTASTINGVPTNIPLNFLLHSTFIDKSGRFVLLGPRGPDLGAPRNAAQVYVWDTDTDTITPITSAMLSSGHGSAGYGAYINQDCCTSSTWEAAQWQFRLLTDVSRTSDLISPVPATKEVFLADHTTWNNAQPSTLVPVISSTYRYGANTTPWRAWDDEIIGIDTTGGIGGIVYRFAHHRSNVVSDTDPSTTYFWYQPIANVSPNGQWVIFTSNWEKTLGTDSHEGTFRQDVFMVHLTPQ